MRVFYVKNVCLFYVSELCKSCVKNVCLYYVSKLFTSCIKNVSVLCQNVCLFYVYDYYEYNPL